MQKIIILLTLLSSLTFGITEKIIIPNEAHSAYIKSLLEHGFNELGYDAKVEILKEKLTAARIAKRLARGTIDLTWNLPSRSYQNSEAIKNVKLFGSLLGSRILLVPLGEENSFKDIKSLDDLRNSGKVAVFGEDWLENKIWLSNNLPVVEIPGDWKKIYPLLGSRKRKIDYTCLGINEVLYGLNTYGMEYNRELGLEKNILLKYDIYFVPFISKKNENKFTMLKNVFVYTDEKGLIKKSEKNHWKDDYAKLNIKNRRVINLPWDFN